MATLRIEISGPGPEPLAGHLSIPACGQGPGLILLPDKPGPDAVIRATADRFAADPDRG
jgi:hypothetical protein